MTVAERRIIYEHARASNSPEADNIIELLFQHRLIDQIGGGLKRSHPTIQAIEAVCRSEQGISAAIAAAEAGMPPMAGVDPLLVANVREYGYFDTTSWAGSFVAGEVEARGWVRSGSKPLPANCVAKTAAFFILSSNGAE